LQCYSVAYQFNLPAVGLLVNFHNGTQTLERLQAIAFFHNQTAASKISCPG